MAFEGLRRLVVETNFAIQPAAVDAVVTLPADRDAPPIETRVLWQTWTPEETPTGAGLTRQTQRRVIAIKVADVPTLPLRSAIIAPLPGEDEPDRRWIVDGFERREVEHHRAIVIEDESFEDT